MNKKKRTPRNQTIVLTKEEEKRLSKKLVNLDSPIGINALLNKTLNSDIFEILKFLPEQFVDLLFIDPPYNLTKYFNKRKFSRKSVEEYTEWIDSFLGDLKKVLKPTSSIYFCSDWNSSTSVHLVLSKYFKIRNRITWERDKGRGAKTNWKNNAEDIWFCTVSDEYTFNVEAVKLRRKVLAPYKNNGQPKDWVKDKSGDYRLTYPSNIWTDISIPFWSMPENTDHPTQKPEKLLAKVILASTNKGDIIFDPFAGSGTTSVVAKKLERQYVGVELDREYACLAEKRLELAENNKVIQGYHDEVFWERNSASDRLKYKK